MFILVDDVESYPEFLPWCNSAEVHNRTAEIVEATLELHKGSLSDHFTTRNTRCEFETIEIELIDGPFRHLQGGWRFTKIGEEGCKLALELDFEFENMFVDMIFGSFFEDTCNSLINAYSKRAKTVFGVR
jgi:ribosome-associated toxin RatA of RatAB toxin-antitoxin module